MLQFLQIASPRFVRQLALKHDVVCRRMAVVFALNAYSPIGPAFNLCAVFEIACLCRQFHEDPGRFLQVRNYIPLVLPDGCNIGCSSFMLHAEPCSI